MSNSSVPNPHMEEAGHQSGQPPPPPPLPPQSSASSSLQPQQQMQMQQQKQQLPASSVDSHAYKNIPLNKHPMTYYQGHHHQANSNHQGTVYAQRADVWSPVSTSVTTPPPPTPDDELLSQLSLDDLISRIRSLETKNRKLLYDNGAMTKDINHHLSSLQQLKQQNYQLVSENNELRELACFLEDERARCRTIAREWQSFGTHMSRVMRHEVSNYSNKLTQLEGKQFELVRENFELKQLCLLLDNALSTRDDPEGSLSPPVEPINSQLLQANSNHSSNGNSNSSQSYPLWSSASKNSNNPFTENSVQPQHRVILSQQILEYIRSLEDRIKQLEIERSRANEQSRQNNSSELYENSNMANNSNVDSRSKSALPTCPQPLLKAMQVLKIQEDLISTDGPNSSSADNRVNPSTNESSNEVITDQHKAFVKGLCNVIWRKIEDTS